MTPPHPHTGLEPSVEAETSSDLVSMTDGALDGPLSSPELLEAIQTKVEPTRASERSSSIDQDSAQEVLEQSGDAAPMTECEQDEAQIERDKADPL